MYKLIVSIVPHNSGEFITEAAKSAGAAGGTIVMGRGTASSNFIQLLGFGDTSKDIVYIIVDDSIDETVRNVIYQASQQKKAHFGVLFSIALSDFCRAGTVQNINAGLQSSAACENKGDTMNNDSYQMINIIVNKGYAEDAMAAARKAGAGGGTIIGARGTAKEGDAKFFGMQIVPEKEMLMILVPSERAEAVVNAVKELPCFAVAGSGIIFCNQAMDFTLLGKNK